MTTTTQNHQYELSLSDIADLREYERERIDFRASIIALKKIRRVHVGEIQTLLFENRDTIRFQIQEMARAERIMSDEGIQVELDTYNPLISRPGKLSATFFLELTSDEQLREWLPKLAGVEYSYELHLGDGDGTTVIKAKIDDGHEETLTRPEVTAAVHYIYWELDSAATQLLLDGPARVVCSHPEYPYSALLSDETRRSLAKDLA